VSWFFTGERCCADKPRTSSSKGKDGIRKISTSVDLAEFRLSMNTSQDPARLSVYTKKQFVEL
jgi:hypothetical protein